MLTTLEQIEQEDSGAKTIIFSQFTSFLDLIEPFLERSGRRFVRCGLLQHLAVWCVTFSLA